MSDTYATGAAMTGAGPLVSGIHAGAIPRGAHTIKVVAGKGTVTDENDRVSLTVIEAFR